MGKALKQKTIFYSREASFVFGALLAVLLLFLTLSIFFKNASISASAANKRNLTAVKNLKQEYHDLEIAYLEKSALLSMEKARELGFMEQKNAKFVSREGVFVKAD